MRKLSAVILCLLITSVLCFSASAHPGGTDSAGGHKNRSTGEYHYHHGQPAHDHYDMDGDGDTDCPYDFKGKNNDKKTSKTESVIKPRGFWDYFLLIFEAILSSFGLSIMIGCVASWVLVFLFGDDRGCFATVFLMVVTFFITLIAFLPKYF